MRWRRWVAVCCVMAGCSSGGSSDAATTIEGIPEYSAPDSAALSATTLPAATTTQPAPTSTLDMRSVPVPDGAPPLPLYSGDPVLMSRALLEFICWVDQNPTRITPELVDLYALPGSAFAAEQRAELERTSTGNIYLNNCVELVEAKPAITDDANTVMAVVSITRPVATEVGPDGIEVPRPTWNLRAVRHTWHLAPDGRWLLDDPVVQSETT